MKVIGVLVCAVLFLSLSAQPADAGPLIAAITAWVSSLSLVGQLVFRLVVSIAASALMQALAPKPREPGIKTEVTQNGGTNPCTFVLMKYATGGSRACPPMSHGNDGDTPNAYLTDVVELGDIRGQVLSRLILNDQYVTIGTTPHADYGLPVLGRYENYAWIKYYDGTQTAADPMLLSKYGSYPQRPWTSDMIGRGLCYAIVTYRYSRTLWGSTVPPRLRFEMMGIPLYDPRKDTTVGGSGAHRWANKATWESTVNPMVAIYNIMRGIALDTGDVWGAGIPAEDLPLASWFAAMNACDVTVSVPGAGLQARYRAGFEVAVDEEPADVISELLKACSGQLAEIGGVWKARVGAVGLPVFNFTDGDVVVSEDQTFAPFPGFTASYNGVHASFPAPGQLWEQKEATPIYNAAWEAEDQGQRLIANLSLPAVPYGAQVRRLMRAYIKDERRFRRHGLTLPPDAAVLEPLDATAWTSPSNGYTSKAFELSEITEDPHTCLVKLALRERDPSDYDSDDPTEEPEVSVEPVIPTAMTVPTFAVASLNLADASGVNRRPAIRLTWSAPAMDGLRGVEYEVRRVGATVPIAKGSTLDTAAGQLVVAQGILPATAYEVRAMPVADRDTAWTGWLPVTSPATPFVRPDIADGAVSDEFSEVLLGPFTVADTPSTTVVPGSTISLGAIGNGQIWRRAMHFDIRFPSTATTYLLVVQLRGRELGGAFGAWEDVDTYSAPVAAANVWEVKRSSGGFSGNYDELQYRLVCRTQPSGGGITSTYQWLRNYYFAAARVTK